MKKLPCIALTAALLCGVAFAAQNRNTNANANAAATNPTKPKRGPIFRATSDQIKQAQTILKQRSFYSGDETGKLTPETRAGLKLFQKAEGLKVTGTLNKLTLEKMGVALTEKQKTM